MNNISTLYLWLISGGSICLIIIIVGQIALFFKKVSDINKQTSKIDLLNSKMDLQNNILREINATLKLIEASNENQDEKMWEFLMERAKTATLVGGLGKMNSPLVITPEVRKLFIPFEHKLQEYYKTVGYKLPEWKLYRDISHLFKDELQNQVCLVLGTTDGECAFMAVSVAKEGSEDLENVVPKCLDETNKEYLEDIAPNATTNSVTIFPSGRLN